jgi:anti-sigma B factor antagonist
MTLKLETRVSNGVVILSCIGRVVFGDEANALRDTLKHLLGSNKQIIVNMSSVSYIDSGGLASLVGACSSARMAGAEIKLMGLGQRIKDTLQVTKLVTVFEVYDSEQQAVAAFHRDVA